MTVTCGLMRSSRRLSLGAGPLCEVSASCATWGRNVDGPASGSSGKVGEGVGVPLLLRFSSYECLTDLGRLLLSPAICRLFRGSPGSVLLSLCSESVSSGVSPVNSTAPPRWMDGSDTSRAGYEMGTAGTVGVEGLRRLGEDSSTNRGVELVGFQSRAADLRRTCCWVMAAGSRTRKGDCCCNWLWLWNLRCWRGA